MMDTDKAFKWFFVMWVISAILSLGIVIGIICTAVHFISKYW